MTLEELKSLRKKTLKLMDTAYKDGGMEFLLDMIVSFHSCEGGAYYNVSDYLTNKGY